MMGGLLNKGQLETHLVSQRLLWSQLKKTKLWVQTAGERVSQSTCGGSPDPQGHPVFPQRSREALGPQTMGAWVANCSLWRFPGVLLQGTGPPLLTEAGPNYTYMLWQGVALSRSCWPPCLLRDANSRWSGATLRPHSWSQPEVDQL